MKQGDGAKIRGKYQSLELSTRVQKVWWNYKTMQGFQTVSKTQQRKQ